MSFFSFFFFCLLTHPSAGAVPGSDFWHRISPTFKIPINAVWGMSLFALLIALPVVNSAEAFSAVTSIATIGARLILLTESGVPLNANLCVRWFASA